MDVISPGKSDCAGWRKTDAGDVAVPPPWGHVQDPQRMLETTHGTRTSTMSLPTYTYL